MRRAAAAALGLLAASSAPAWQGIEQQQRMPGPVAGCGTARGWGLFQWLVGENSYTGMTSVDAGTLVVTPPGSSWYRVEGNGMLCVSDWEASTPSTWSCPCPGGTETDTSGPEPTFSGLSHTCADQTLVTCTLSDPGSYDGPLPVAWVLESDTLLEFINPDAPSVSLAVNGIVYVPVGGLVTVSMADGYPRRGYPVHLIAGFVVGTFIAGSLPAGTELYTDSRGLWLRETP